MGRKTEILGMQWSVEWSNPYTEPPDGVEKVQFALCVIGENRRRPKEIDDFMEMMGFGLGSGWSICVVACLPPRRELPEASKQSARRKKLMTKLQKKHPLFAEQFYEEKIKEMPDYYGVDPETLEVL